MKTLGLTILFFVIILQLSVCAIAQDENDTHCNCDSLFEKIYDAPQGYILFFRKQDIPNDVKHFLKSHDGYRFKLANPWKKYNESDVNNPFLHDKRLIMYAQRGPISIIVYEQGGIGLSINMITLVKNKNGTFHYCSRRLNGTRGSLFVKQLFAPKVLEKSEFEN